MDKGFKASLLAGSSINAVDMVNPLSQVQFNETCKRSGIELGTLAMVRNPATRKTELARVMPDYWRKQHAKDLK